MPYFGGGLFGQDGAGLIQPIFVKDVARAFVQAIDNPASVGKTYELGGADRLTWPRMHQIAAEAIVGRRRWTAPLPAWLAKAMTRVAPASLLPFNRDQVEMSQEDNVCDMTPFVADFGWRPAGFAETLNRYVGEL
jgi:NADH dehydrogenase